MLFQTSLNDVVDIYDGPTQQSPLLSSLSGSHSGTAHSNLGIFAIMNALTYNHDLKCNRCHRIYYPMALAFLLCYLLQVNISLSLSPPLLSLYFLLVALEMISI